MQLTVREVCDPETKLSIIVREDKPLEDVLRHFDVQKAQAAECRQEVSLC